MTLEFHARAFLSVEAHPCTLLRRVFQVLFAVAMAGAGLRAHRMSLAVCCFDEPRFRVFRAVA